jgi:dTDP-4-amino-4,6-dideoxygalactose transaminase
VDLGSSYLPGEMVAAFLFAQLKHLSAITQKKIEIWNRYHEALYPLEQEGILRRPIIPPGCEHNGHLYYILLNDAKTRDVTLSVLNRRGIQAVFHYVPLHSSPAGLRYGRAFDSLTVTETTSQRLIRLPSWIGLDSVEIIVRELKECLTNLR